jgi:hypothetical protein
MTGPPGGVPPPKKAAAPARTRAADEGKGSDENGNHNSTNDGDSLLKKGAGRHAGRRTLRVLAETAGLVSPNGDQVHRWLWLQQVQPAICRSSTPAELPSLDRKRLEFVYRLAEGRRRGIEIGAAYPASTHASIDDAQGSGRRLRRCPRRHTRLLHRNDTDGCIVPLDFNSYIPPPPVTGILTDPGTGKTRQWRKQVAVPLVTQGFHLGLAVPRHDLAEEIVADFAEDGIHALSYRGLDANDPKAPGHKMCREQERIGSIQQALADVSRYACKRADKQCQFYDICGYNGSSGNDRKYRYPRIRCSSSNGNSSRDLTLLPSTRASGMRACAGRTS